MDKIKDFLHDYSDVFFAIAVASVMFAVLSWNLGNWFDDSSNTVLTDNSTYVSENEDTDSIIDKSDDKTDLENKEEPEKEEIKDNETTNEEIKDPENTEQQPTENEVEQEKPVVSQIITITIPNGTPGSGVAKILKENGLISDTNEFIKVAESLNLAVKLKSGTFEIPANSTIEDMVKIIAGQKK